MCHRTLSTRLCVQKPANILVMGEGIEKGCVKIGKKCCLVSEFIGLLYFNTADYPHFITYLVLQFV